MEADAAWTSRGTRTLGELFQIMRIRNTWMEYAFGGNLGLDPRHRASQVCSGRREYWNQEIRRTADATGITGGVEHLRRVQITELLLVQSMASHTLTGNF